MTWADSSAILSVSVHWQDSSALRSEHCAPESVDADEQRGRHFTRSMQSNEGKMLRETFRLELRLGT